MNWSAQKQLDYLKSLEKKEELTDDDMALLSTFSKDQERSVLSKDEEISIKSELASQLVRFESDFCKKLLLNLTYDADVLVRVEACDSLCIYNDREVFNCLQKLSMKDRFLVRSYAVTSMADVAVNGAFDFKEVLQLLKSNFSREKSVYVKLRYYYAFCILGEREYYDVILQHLHHKNYQIRCCAINLLMDLIKENEYVKTLQSFIECEENEKTIAVQSSLAKAISKIKLKM